MSGNKKIRIAIVGAGLAGLTTAYELSKNPRIEVVVFEAESEVGGRVKSVEVAGQHLDLGGFIIYPWYTNYHRLIKELGLKDQLKKIGKANILYQTSDHQIFGEDYALPKAVKIKLATALGKIWLRHKPNFRNPNLTDFQGQTLAEFLVKNNSNDPALREFLDTINQGYCYAPLSKYEMTFYAPFIYQTLLHGDLRTGHYFGGNNQLFTKALAAKIQSQGGEIRLQTPVTVVTKNIVQTKHSKDFFDAIVLASPVSKLYEEIISVPTFDYTYFYAVVMKLPHAIVIKKQPDWSALFVAPFADERAQITSLIKAHKMVPKLGEEYLIINYKVLNQKNIPRTVLEAQLNTELNRIFPDSGEGELVAVHHWKQTMPIATTDFVKEVQSKQGEQNLYFAGDYLGAPSMETAVSSGVRVAKLITEQLS